MSQAAIDIETELRDKLLDGVMRTRNYNHQLLVSLASELAMDIQPIHIILKTHCIDRAQLDAILQQELFQTLFREAQMAWGSTASASVRIKAKMESMVELSLPELFAELKKDGLTTAKVELLKAMMRGSGIGEKASAGTGAEGVKIEINIGDVAPKATATIDIPFSREAEDA